MTLWSNRLCWEHVCQMWEGPSRMLEECSTRWSQYRFGLLEHDALRIICPPWQWNRSSCTLWENAWRCRVGISPLILQEQQKPIFKSVTYKIVCNKNPYFKIHNFVSQMGFWRWAFCCQMQNHVQQTKTHFQNPSWVFCGMILYPRWVLKVDFCCQIQNHVQQKPIFKIHLGLLLHNFVSQMDFEQGTFVVHDILFRTFEEGGLYFLGSCKIIGDSHSCFVFSTAPWMLLEAWINFFCSWHGVTSDTYSEPTFTFKPKPCKEEELGTFKRERSHKKTWK